MATGIFFKKEDFSLTRTPGNNELKMGVGGIIEIHNIYPCNHLDIYRKAVSNHLDKETVSNWRREVRKNKSLEKAARQGTLEVSLYI